MKTTGNRDTDRETAGRPGRDELAAAFQLHARLASDERTAALRAMSGRLAHRLRNPLAAVQAACSSLRDELTDPDHQERLDLTLQQVSRALALITAEVQAVAQPPEAPRAVQPAREIAEVIAVLRATDPQAQRLRPAIGDDVPCTLRRAGFRVAVYSLLKLLLQTGVEGTPGEDAIEVELHSGQDRLEMRVGLAECASNLQDAGSPPAVNASSDSADAINLLIVERFARDAGGQLKRWTDDRGAPVFSLELVCRNV